MLSTHNTILCVITCKFNYNYFFQEPGESRGKSNLSSFSTVLSTEFRQSVVEIIIWKSQLALYAWSLQDVIKVDRCRMSLTDILVHLKK